MNPEIIRRLPLHEQIQPNDAAPHVVETDIANEDDVFFQRSIRDDLLQLIELDSQRQQQIVDQILANISPEDMRREWFLFTDEEKNTLQPLIHEALKRQWGKNGDKEKAKKLIRLSEICREQAIDRANQAREKINRSEQQKKKNLTVFPRAEIDRFRAQNLRQQILHLISIYREKGDLIDNYSTLLSYIHIDNFSTEITKLANNNEYDTLQTLLAIMDCSKQKIEEELKTRFRSDKNFIDKKFDRINTLTRIILEVTARRTKATMKPVTGGLTETVSLD